MHDSIKKFSIHGQIDDSNIPVAKERLVLFIEQMMRDKGCAPVLELDPQFTATYVPEKETFKFDLSVYGAWVGKEKAWEVSGVSNGKLVMKSTTPIK